MPRFNRMVVNGAISDRNIFRHSVFVQVKCLQATNTKKYLLLKPHRLPSSSNYKKLMAVAYDDLRHRLVFSGSFEDVTQVDVSLEGATYTLTSEEKDDERTFFYQEEELEIDDFESALRLLTADSFTSEKPTQKKEIELIVHLDNENYPQVKIELYRYDGSNCLAVVDGESVSLVPRSEVVELIEAVNAIILN